jgi:hypothetical protein
MEPLKTKRVRLAAKADVTKVTAIHLHAAYNWIGDNI